MFESVCTNLPLHKQGYLFPLYFVQVLQLILVLRGHVFLALTSRYERSITNERIR